MCTVLLPPGDNPIAVNKYISYIYLGNARALFVEPHVGLSIAIYRVSQEECARLRESIPYVKVYRYNPKHPYPKLNGYGDNGQRILKF
jgi:hypothetical protein